MPTVNDPDGTAAVVNAEGQLTTTTIAATPEHHVNHVHGEAYSVKFSQSPTAADDCFFYMANTSELDLVIEGITLGFIDGTAADDPEIYMKLNDLGSRNSATALTPVNLNAGSGKSADGTFEQGADLDGGAATLTGGTEFERLVYANDGDVSSSHFNFEQDLILPKNKTLTMWANDSGATYFVTVFFNYHDQSTA